MSPWAAASLGLLLAASGLRAENGSDLWLRYSPLEEGAVKEAWKASATALVWENPAGNETLSMAALEVFRGCRDMLENSITMTAKVRDGAIILGTPRSSALVAGLGLKKELKALGREGFLIRRVEVSGQPCLAIASEGEIGCLYGAFHLMRQIKMGKRPEEAGISDSPRIKRRLLNHWDNLDRSIERGYAGKSLWDWEALPGDVSNRVPNYAYFNASLGVNGVVLNNVNTNPDILKRETLLKVKALADTFRPWGIRVYLSANFGTPKAFGELDTADPYDTRVRQWWRDKAREIYKLIPDFGGFLVKANSEGQPGPLDYKRSHADGANMLAAALKAHGGVVIWRAFVYNPGIDRDRVKRAYLELMPLDGQFASNVFIQAKNGPLDFQPREPFHPLFQSMKKTKVGAELQVTQEYLGHSNHLAYLGTMWQEFFEAAGPSWRGGKDSLIAGVANTGSDENWCGSDFAQANWYAYGRMAWNPELKAEDLAREWARQTWCAGAEEPVVKMMMASRQAVVDYTSPLGLAGVFERDSHYAPDPGMVDERHDDWSAAYFVRADKGGLGYERGRGGSGAVDQYEKALADRFDGLDSCPEEFLLWFHHVPWQRKLGTGRTLIKELGFRFERGVKAARQQEKDWAGLKDCVDAERHAAVAAKLKLQSKEAAAWAAKSMKYYEGVMKGAIPGHPFGPQW